MTDNLDSDGKKPREPYEPPQAVRLTGPDFALGICSAGTSATKYNEACYRGNGFAGNCITGKSPSGSCAAGISGGS